MKFKDLKILEKWLKKSSKKRIFTTIFNHLRSQQFKQAKDQSGCVLYDPETGNQCAFGGLLDPSLARKLEEEGDTLINNILEDYGIKISKEKYTLIKELQVIHDTGDTPQRMMDNLLDKRKQF